MSIKKILLHVGYPKSGSTAIQDFCVRNEAFLKSNGVMYPTLFRQEGSTKHEELFRLVRVGRTSKAIKFLTDYLNSVKERTIFLSTESIVNQLHIIEDAEWQMLFEGLRRLGQLELILVTRDSESLIRSYYKQAVVNQPSTIDFYGTSLPLDEFSKHPLIQRLLDFSSTINKLSVLSHSHVEVIKYSDDIVCDVISRLIGARVETSGFSRSNKSLKNEEVELIRQINGFNLPSSHRNAWLNLLSQCSTLNSVTALALAARADENIFSMLEPELMLKIRQNMNSSLRVENGKLISLAGKLRHRLLAIQNVKS